MMMFLKGNQVSWIIHSFLTHSHIMTDVLVTAVMVPWVSLQKLMTISAAQKSFTSRSSRVALKLSMGVESRVQL
jgi:hypothetical protein